MQKFRDTLRKVWDTLYAKSPVLAWALLVVLPILVVVVGIIYLFSKKTVIGGKKRRILSFVQVFGLSFLVGFFLLAYNYGGLV